MCGLAGGAWSERPVDLEHRLTAALSYLQRRGPDHQGYQIYRSAGASVALAHARLSIIDLSLSAQQPMASADRRYELLFNGELYNYLELRAELEAWGASFVTNSDTEVLLAAWAFWGKSALDRFKGMFAIVVLDKQVNSLTVVRDAFGIKPLFYQISDDSFVFASELSALTAIKSDSVNLNLQRTYDYLVHGEYDFGNECFVQGVKTLQPGHLLTVDLSAFRVSEPVAWWSPKIHESPSLSFKDASDHLRELFLSNVRLHMRSDVPIGAALSGGLDSSAIVCAMRYLEPDAELKTFSYIAKDSQVSEEYWVDLVNNHNGASSHKVVVSPGELEADLEELIRAQGEPFGSTSIYAQYRVFKLAKEHGVTVTLEGQGADELLGGYNGYPGQRIRSLVEHRRFKDVLSFFNAWSAWPGRSRLDALKRVASVYADGWLYDRLRNLNGMAAVPEWIRAAPLRDSGVHLGYPDWSVFDNAPTRRMMATLADSVSQRGLLGLLRHGDRNSMRFSVESRVPFLTTDMADFMLSLPEEYLVSLQGETKTLLRSALRGIVPDAVLDRRDKIGFATPEQQWLMGMAGTIRMWLQEDLDLPFLDQRKLLEHFDQVVSGKRPYSWQVWRWVNFVQWYKITF